MHQQGTGPATTQTFTVRNAEWALTWSFSCIGDPTHGNSLSLVVRSLDGSGYADTVYRRGVTGTDVSYEHQAGAFAVGVTTSCSWTLTATG